MNNNIAIKVENLSKCYQIYEQPRDRLKQMILPRLQRAVGAAPKQYFREFWALKNVSFEVKKGETVGIIGRNGSGKSTLLQMICGTLNPTSGGIQTNGRIAALLELGSGFNPEFTGRENVYLNASVLGLSKEETDQRFDEIAAFAEIGNFIDQPVKTYSSGMMVRLAFAVAINIEPDILIVDEALAVGDELFQRKCFSRIESIRASGVTILFVSHSASQIVELCDRCMLMDAGEKLADGIPKPVVARYQKLLYASVEKRESLRQQIQDEARSTDTVLMAAPALKAPSEAKANEGYKEFFDPDFKPKSTFGFEPRGAEIFDVGMRTLAGDAVNSIFRGRRYLYIYKVRFYETAHAVRFGMAFNTTSGLFLGGAYSAAEQSQTIPSVQAGEIVAVEFEFTCTLNPGTYYSNAGAYCLQDAEEIIMHRVIDAMAFRVMPMGPDCATGLIWLSAGASVLRVGEAVLEGAGGDHS